VHNLAADTAGNVLNSADEYIAVIASAGASEGTTWPEAEVIHAL
jgi:hypothetical protein